MAEKASPTLPMSCAVLPKLQIRLTILFSENNINGAVYPLSLYANTAHSERRFDPHP